MFWCSAVSCDGIPATVPGGPLGEASQRPVPHEKDLIGFVFRSSDALEHVLLSKAFGAPVSVVAAGVGACAAAARSQLRRRRWRSGNVCPVTPGSKVPCPAGLCGQSSVRRCVGPPRAPRVRSERFHVDDESVGGQDSYDDADDEDSEGFGGDLGANVVKVFVTTSSPSYMRPWTKKPQSSSTGTAFPITKGQLLTNAHVVQDATVVRVRRRGDYRKYIAHVERMCPLRDLALLSLDAPQFWDGLEVLDFEPSLPYPQDPVRVVGYPGDSDNVCVTRGVVSRIDMNWYTHDVQLLAVQIDAAINPGNSGGPVLDDDGYCVGVAFEKITDSDVDNVGYIIPMEVVGNFLDEQPTSSRSGVGCVGFEYQTLESEAARLACGLPRAEPRGVRVRHVDVAAPSYHKLQVGDVVLSVDGVDVGCDGTVPLADGRHGERVPIGYLSSRRWCGESLTLQVWRQEGDLNSATGTEIPADGIGHILHLEIELARPGELVPSTTQEALPEYLLVAGLVFVPLTEPYLEDAYGPSWDTDAPAYLVHLYDDGRRQAKDEQTIVLAHALCAGGEETAGLRQVGQTLKFLNGKPMLNLRAVADAVECSARWLCFEFANGDVVVVDGLTAKERRKEVMLVHQIQRPMQLSGTASDQ